MEFTINLQEQEYSLIAGALDDSRDYYLNKQEEAENNGKPEDAEHYKKKAQNIADLKERILTANCKGVKPFTEEQLYLIRDTFACMCSTSVECGKLENAEEELEIINTTQSQLDEEEYKDLTQMELHDNGTWNEIEERELEDFEEDSKQALIAWAQSEETEPTESLKASVKSYLRNKWDYERDTKEAAERARFHSLNRLIALCLRECTGEQIKKLQATAKNIVKDI